jgi:3-methyladenine DNA glycosylase AlkD
MLSAQAEILIDRLTESFISNANEDEAFFMSKYMKNRFEFLVIKKPLRAQLSKEVMGEIKKKHPDEIISISKHLWNKEPREFQYIALELLMFWAKKSATPFLQEVEWFITHKSWWDSVDVLAVNVAGTLMFRFPNLKNEMVVQWSESENMWLNRTAILFQLKWKAKTDWDLLQLTILKHSSSSTSPKTLSFATNTCSVFNNSSSFSKYFLLVSVLDWSST